MNSPIPGKYVFIVTAEHASEEIPQNCKNLLSNHFNSCEVHQRFDPGTKEIATALANKLHAPLVLGRATRLAIDLNRSLGNPELFSQPIFDADEELKAGLIQEYHLPFRKKVKELVQQSIQEGDTVIHLSVHSFTHFFKGKLRAVEIGVLFDDSRKTETVIGEYLTRVIKAAKPDLRVKSNEPYQGKSDGHTTALRRLFPESQYLGIEFEFSQLLDLVSDAEDYADLLVSTFNKLRPKQVVKAL